MLVESDQGEAVVQGGVEGFGNVKHSSKMKGWGPVA